MGKLDNKVAVVTGASKGIGAAIAIKFAAAGASVIVNYSSSKEAAERVVATIAAAGGKAVAVGADMSNESHIAQLFAETQKHFDRVDILVNNAGIYNFGPIESITAEQFHKHFDLNVLGLLLATRAAVPLFPATGGAVINISSIGSTWCPPNTSLYNGTKGAVDSITRVLAKELGPKQIRVNAINPGVIVTEGMDSTGLIGSPMEQQILAQTPLGRLGTADDIALPTVFLASDDARFITGETLYVSGGLAT